MTPSARVAWITVAALASATAMFYLLKDALFPFAVAFLLAYIMDPLLDRMERLKVPRTLSIILLLTLVLLSVFVAGFMLYPILEQQVLSAAEQIPHYSEKLRQKITPLLEKLGEYDREQINAFIENGMEKMGTIPLHILKGLYGMTVSAVSSVTGMISALFGMVVIPVATFYFMRDIDSMMEKIRALIPERYREKVGSIFRDIDSTLSSYVRGQFTIALVMAFFYSLGLYLVGTPMGLFIGILAGLSQVVPYLPLVTGLIPALILTYLHFGDVWHPLYVLGIFGAVQMLEGFYLTPKIMGESLGLHPIFIMFALLAGGMLFGIVGIILAVPAAAVIKVVTYHLDRYYRSSGFYRNKD